jgi:hypothetical protein
MIALRTRRGVKHARADEHRPLHEMDDGGKHLLQAGVRQAENQIVYHLEAYCRAFLHHAIKMWGVEPGRLVARWRCLSLVTRAKFKARKPVRCISSTRLSLRLAADIPFMARSSIPWSPNSSRIAPRIAVARFWSKLRLHQSSLPQPSAPVCVVAGRRVPPAWRAACVAAAGLAASCARPSLAGAAGGSAMRGDASAWGHVQRGFIFPILARGSTRHRHARTAGDAHADGLPPGRSAG